MQSTSSATYKDVVTLLKKSKETLHYLRRNEASVRGEIPSLPTFSMTYSPRKEGVNGVNRIATKGEKYYWLPTKREKNYRLPIGKILTDYRHGRTLSIFYFTEKGASCIFPTFLGSNLRYHRLSKFNWKDKKGEKPNICCFDGRHKSFLEIYHYRGYWNSLHSIWKFLQSNPPIPAHYPRENLTLILKENYFQFIGKQSTYKSTVPRCVQRQEFSFWQHFHGIYWNTSSLSKIVFKLTVWKRYIDDIFSLWDISKPQTSYPSSNKQTYITLLLNSPPKFRLRQCF